MAILQKFPKSEKWCLYHYCAFLALWAATESCWYVQFSFPKYCWAQGNTTDWRTFRVNSLVNFNTLEYENQRCFVNETNCGPNHNRQLICAWIMVLELLASADLNLSFWWLCAHPTGNSFSSIDYAPLFLIYARWINWRYLSSRMSLFSSVRKCTFRSL